MDPTHALYVLLDSNLPTGGFVASGGLESYAKHGFVARQSSTPYADVGNNVQLPDFSREKESFGGKGTSQPRSAAPLGSQAGPAIMRFSNCEMDNFEGTTGYYLVHAWRAVRDLRGGDAGVGDIKPNTSKSVEDTIARLISLDHAHEATLLSHVSRRASKAQGVALLTLYARGMVPPPGFEGMTDDTLNEVFSGYRRATRLGSPGHLAVCFGLVAACLGLDLQTTRHLYLFTHARSTLSAAVRLNVVGPYLSTQLLSHPVRAELVTVLAQERDRVALLEEKKVDKSRWDWEWAEQAERGPATTWPLGEILAARHDLQHSRIFNS